MNEVITQLISTTAIVSLVGYLGQKVFQMILDSKLDQFKQKMEQENELYRANLSLLAKEHEVKFMMLHEERAGAIKQLYELMVHFTDNARGIVLVFRSNPGLAGSFISDMVNVYKDILNFHRMKKIYFSEDFSNRFTKFEKQGQDFINSTQAINVNATESELLELFNDYSSFINESLLPTKASVEKEFRILIGVDSQKLSKQ